MIYTRKSKAKVSSDLLCLVSKALKYGPCTDGREIVHSQRGSDAGQYHVPTHLTVDDNESLFAVDANNRRVTLLSPMLSYIDQVVSRDQVKW